MRICCMSFDHFSNVQQLGWPCSDIFPWYVELLGFLKLACPEVPQNFWLVLVVFHPLGWFDVLITWKGGGGGGGTSTSCDISVCMGYAQMGFSRAFCKVCGSPMAGSPGIAVSSSLSGIYWLAYPYQTCLTKWTCSICPITLGFALLIWRGKGGKRKDGRDGVALAPSNRPPGR